MLKVKDIMTTEVITVSPDTEITQAARLLLEKRINGLPVVDDNGELKGIICQSDIISQQKKLPIPSFFTFLDGIIPLSSTKEFERQIQKIAATNVSQIMTKNPVSVNPDSSISGVADLMVDNNFHTLPVMEKGKLVGIIGKEDVLRTLMSETG